jgi:molybdopterin molybdotransferase
MISADEALEVVLAETPRLGAEESPLADALGAVLAEPIAADMDIPPFDKSAMDGYAVRAADVARLPALLAVIDDLPAGVAPARPLGPGTCAKIMTGAPVPPGADLVIPVEDTEALAGGRARILRIDPARPNVCAAGEDVRKGATVLRAGQVLRPQEIGVLASVGRERVSVGRRPRVAVLATGDELVPPGAAPGPGQIRNSNSASLLAACRRAAVTADDLGVARDDKADLRARIAEGLQRDVLLVSGGISMGERDLVPAVFDELAVKVRFATVRMKPGKPTLFATHGRRLVFGLPGNPVSTLVAFRVLVWPCLRKMVGHPVPAPPPILAALAETVHVGGDRTTYMASNLRSENGRWAVRTVQTRGPADLVGFCRADALAVLEPGDYAAGTAVRVLPLEMPGT